MKNKNLIVVQNVFEDLSKTNQSIKSIRFAAHRWKTDFYEMCYFKNESSPSSIFWDRIWAMENFENYEKVLILDPDVIINETSPNIFDLLDENCDLCVVKNFNEGRLSSELFEKISNRVSKLHNSLDIFERKIKNFSSENYLKNYFNMGVFLYKPDKLHPEIQKLKELIFNDEEIVDYCSYKKKGDWYHSQNLTSAFLTHSSLNIKFLPKEWNWLSPDINTEWNTNYFLGPMKPFIYHFTGTNLAKERLINYTNWQQNG
jgi:lipopolysaccharide biosynthesis glycosyltransferase